MTQENKSEQPQEEKERDIHLLQVFIVHFINEANVPLFAKDYYERVKADYLARIERGEITYKAPQVKSHFTASKAAKYIKNLRK